MSVAELVAGHDERDAEQLASWYARDATIHPDGSPAAVDVAGYDIQESQRARPK
jgi:hypothetical protein